MVTEWARTITLAITGASGAAYALRLLECLVEAKCRLWVLVSQPGRIVLSTEADLRLPSRPAEMTRQLAERFGAAPGQLQVFGSNQWMAPLASGSAAPDAMVICPCTTGTLAAVASGVSRSLLERAADVVIKEGRRLVLVLRETPLSAIHLRHMLELAQLGVVILPANPGFYHAPKSVQDLVDFVVSRILDQLGIPNDLTPRWGGERG